MSRHRDLTGQNFGRLVVEAFAGKDSIGKVLWFCRCECGGTKTTRAENLSSGSTRSCGCMAQEQREAAAKKRNHDFSRANNTKEYRAWESMIRRCYDPKHASYARYSAAGIKVCDTWRESFAAFLTCMGKAPNGATLDRIDNSRGYEPGNCRWATMKQQANNRRSNTLLTFNGETLNIQGWSERLGRPKSTITNRIRYGWSVERALTELPRHR